MASGTQWTTWWTMLKKNVAVAEPRTLGKTEEKFFKGQDGVKDSVVGGTAQGTVDRGGSASQNSA